MGKLANAIRARVVKSRAALKALGIDSSLLNDPELKSSMRGGKFDPRDHTSGEIGGGVEREGEDTDPPIERPSPEQRMSADDDDDDEYADFASYLRDHGIAEDVIKGAVDFHRRRGRGMDRRKGNGYDSHADDRRRAKDRLPLRAGRFNKPRFDEEGHEVREQRELASGRIIDHGIDGRPGRFAHDRGLQEIRQVHEIAGALRAGGRMPAGSQPLCDGQQAAGAERGTGRAAAQADPRFRANRFTVRGWPRPSRSGAPESIRGVRLARHAACGRYV